MKILILLTLLSSCAVNHKASGNVETKGEITVTINYKNCDRPDWSHEDVIECVREASNFEVSVKDADIIATILRSKQDEQETKAGTGTNTGGSQGAGNTWGLTGK